MNNQLELVRFGKLVIEFDVAGNLRITRQDNAMHIELSCSEWAAMVQFVNLRWMPAAPPYVVEPHRCQVDCTVMSAGG